MLMALLIIDLFRTSNVYLIIQSLALRVFFAHLKVEMIFDGEIGGQDEPIVIIRLFEIKQKNEIESGLSDPRMRQATQSQVQRQVTLKHFIILFLSWHQPLLGLIRAVGQ